MNKKKQTILLISIIVIVGIALSIQLYYDDQRNNIKYYDNIPVNQEDFIAQSDNALTVAHAKQERFYINTEKHVDDGIFYESQQKHADKGFLIEKNKEGSFSSVY